MVTFIARAEKGAVRVSGANLQFIGFRIVALNGGHVGGGGQVVDNRVQQGLDAVGSEGAAAEDWDQLAGDGGLA